MGAAPRSATVLADVGGTTARFALLGDNLIGAIEHLAACDYPMFADALPPSSPEMPRIGQ
jgi:glucokinase